ncbi:hypothetical protein [Oleiharenicola sp. Vm1]|uniref:hypothetical protein n=1 Tax=Oleiharenicola sp. Vm1 TaxID=3398393 RepID=UPI0039F57DE4
MNATDPALAERLEALDRKLDLVLEEMAAVRRVRREIDELRDDLTRVGREMIPALAGELDAVSTRVRPDDVAALLKQVLRSVDDLNASLAALHAARELLQDATPIARQLMNDAVAKFDELDRKGYFEKGRELTRVLDNVVANFSVEDIRLLSENVVAILSTVKNLTQPEMLEAINNAVEVYKKIDFESVEEFSLWTAFKEVNKPEMRRGLGFLIVFLRNLSAHTPAPRVVPPARS